MTKSIVMNADSPSQWVGVSLTDTAELLEKFLYLFETKEELFNYFININSVGFEDFGHFLAPKVIDHEDFMEELRYGYDRVDDFKTLFLHLRSDLEYVEGHEDQVFGSAGDPEENRKMDILSGILDTDFGGSGFPCCVVDFKSSKLGRFHVIGNRLWFREYEAIWRRSDDTSEETKATVLDVFDGMKTTRKNESGSHGGWGALSTNALACRLNNFVESFDVRLDLENYLKGIHSLLAEDLERKILVMPLEPEQVPAVFDRDLEYADDFRSLFKHLPFEQTIGSPTHAIELHDGLSSRNEVKIEALGEILDRDFLNLESSFAGADTEQVGGRRFYIDGTILIFRMNDGFLRRSADIIGASLEQGGRLEELKK